MRIPTRKWASKIVLVVALMSLVTGFIDLRSAVTSRAAASAQSDRKGGLVELSAQTGGDRAPARAKGDRALGPGKGGSVPTRPSGTLGVVPTAPTGCTTTTTNFTNNTALTIADDAVVTSTITVAGAGAYLWDLNMQTFIAHRFPGHLDITLTSPAGTTVTITNDNGAGNENVFNGTVWDDQANPGGQVPYATNDGLVTDHAYGNLRLASPLVPEEALAAFRGENPNGTWTITISDDSAGDAGSLTSWELEISTLSVTPTETTTSVTNSTPVAIPNGPAVVSDTVTIADAGTVVSKVTLMANIQHTFPADLDITIMSPAGTVVTLTTHNGAGKDHVFNGMLWDDDANRGGKNSGMTTDHLYANRTTATPLTPKEALGAFNGQNPNGTWTLTVSDDLREGSGSLNNWTLSVTTAGGGVCESIACPANVTQSNDPNQCGAVVTYPPPTPIGACDTITCSPASGSFFPVGTTTVTCTSSAGPTCTFTVTVNDTQPPTITCPANQTKCNDPNQCGAVVTYPLPTASDNCPGVTTMCSPASGSFFPKGTTTVTCTATDASGNTATCTFTVTVNDCQPPTITCPPNQTAVTNQNTCPPPGLGSCQVVTFTATASDNCPGVTVVCNPPSGSCFPVGTTTVTCTATDTSGNTATCTFTVTAFDVCLQDDSSPTTVLLFNSLTGDYRFCCKGTTFTGKGKVTRQGCVFTLEHNPLDRRVRATTDKAVFRGNASIQSPPGMLRCTITDGDIRNNTCVCQ